MMQNFCYLCTDPSVSAADIDACISAGQVTGCMSSVS